MIRVPRPRVVSVVRSRPGQASPGDVAEARLDPGLLALLDGPLGAGFQPRYILPVGLATTAALAVLAPASDGINWAGTSIDLDWFAVPDLQDIVLVQARLEQLSRYGGRFKIHGRTGTGVDLYDGTFQMAAIRQGVAVAFRSAEEYDAVRSSLKRTAPGTRQNLQVVNAPASIPLGKTASVELEAATTATVTGHPPYGFGISFEGPVAHDVPAGGRVRFTVRADRPHEVNLGQPWELKFTAGNETVSVQIAVRDPNPGRTFYLLTEDCETFDGGPLTGSYAGAEDLGNHNNFMDPEEYRIQMVLKPNRMNEIAERHGTRWTHFYAATQRFAAEWAARQSRTGAWDRVVAEMDAAVRSGSRLHEYAPHIHFDYEPDSKLPPQPRLVYDARTDGILPADYYHPEKNPTHCYHDWDGSARGISYIKRLGDWSDLDSKTGSLRKTLQHLSRLQANRRATLVGRTGSYDFGKSAEDQAISTEAYVANGLRGNSDLYRLGEPPAPGGEMFWCAKEDRASAVEDLRACMLVQFGIKMDTGFSSAEELNGWFRAEWEAARGPGVHGIVLTTHAMFMAGAPDRFRSLEGGAFDVLDEHLAWIRRNYADVEFATATEALLEYVDYYTPVLDAFTEPHLCGGDPQAGRYEFPVRLLGRGIRVDETHPATVYIAAPACFSPDELAGMRLVQNGQMLAAASGFDPRQQPAIRVELRSRSELRLEIVLRPAAARDALKWFEPVFYDPPEAPGQDLLRIRGPMIEGCRLRFSNEVIQLLMNTIAGGSEPLGRRTHPLGGFALGAALTMAFHHARSHSAAAENAAPVLRRIQLQLRNRVELDSDLITETDGKTIKVLNDTGELIAKAEAFFA